MSQSYFNTTQAMGMRLRRYIAQAENQQEAIMRIFKEHRKVMSPSEVHNVYCYCNSSMTPLTSIRRAMTVLTKRGKLEKTDIQVNGPYGRPEYVWRLPVTQPKLF